ncbi:MAG: hypothetical protein JRF61_11025 [Deltaproteobacteria bacterium]|jgi:hypothetical protein|nr:hypothetical protein [Deltaproteobacteria bacterium]
MRRIDEPKGRWTAFHDPRIVVRCRSWALVSTWLVVLATGCASPVDVQRELVARMALGDYPGAIEIVEDEKAGAYGGRNRLLYFLERGMLLHVAGDYTESNRVFERAKRLGERLYTRSVGNAGLSLMSNDLALDYAGENFERTLIHLFAALNYQQLGRHDSALVEVRQLADYLRKLQVDSLGENIYQEDAFARYLSALLHEASGDVDAAFVDYKKAVSAYGDYLTRFAVPRPQSLGPNAARVAADLGEWAREDLKALGNEGAPRLVPEEAGEVIVLHYNGLSPVKAETRFTIPFSEAWLMVLALRAMADEADAAKIDRATAVYSQIAGIDIVSVAFPKFVDRPYAIERMAIRVPGAFDATPPELVEDIGAIARRDLDDRIVRIRTRAIARAAIKYALQKAAERAALELAGDYGGLIRAVTMLGGNLARYGSERADQRVWSTLPDEIWMSTLVLPAGSHDLTIDFLDAGQRVVESRIVSGVEVAPGGREYVIVRTVR